MALHVRRARSDELPQVGELLHDSWCNTYAELIGDTAVEKLSLERHALDVIADQYARQGWFLVAERGGQVVGHLYAVSDDAGVFLDSLHVRPDTKGQGVGTALLARLEEDLQPGALIALHVLKGNSAAIAFYQRRGFIIAGETDACFGRPGIPADVLERRVG